MARFGFMFGAVAMVLAGCSGGVKQSDLDRSLTTWNALKAENGNSYRYEASLSTGIGSPSTTTLTVRDGVVVSRSYTRSDVNETGERVTTTWTEEGEAVGAHEEGSEPLTLDARYERCKNDVLTQNSASQVILLEFETNGVLTFCEAFPRDIFYGGGFDGGGEYLRGLEFLPATEPAELPNPFVRALDIAEGGWNGLKTTYGDSYRYVVDAAAVFGPLYNTVLTVRSGKVVRRDFTLTELDDGGEATVVRRWSETGEALGTHDEGAALLTVDERFAACRTDLEAADLAGSDVGLDYIAPTNAKPEEEFVLSSCLILSKGVVDDGGGEIVRRLEFLTD